MYNYYTYKNLHVLGKLSTDNPADSGMYHFQKIQRNLYRRHLAKEELIAIYFVNPLPSWNVREELSVYREKEHQLLTLSIFTSYLSSQSGALLHIYLISYSGQSSLYFQHSQL